MGPQVRQDHSGWKRVGSSRSVGVQRQNQAFSEEKAESKVFSNSENVDYRRMELMRLHSVDYSCHVIYFLCTQVKAEVAQMLLENLGHVSS